MIKYRPSKSFTIFLIILWALIGFSAGLEGLDSGQRSLIANIISGLFLASIVFAFLHIHIIIFFTKKEKYRKSAFKIALLLIDIYIAYFALSRIIND